MATESSSTTLKSWLGMNIPKLNDSNYRIWKALMSEILLAKDLKEYVDGSLTEPDEEDDKKVLKKWQQGNATASATIKGALTPGQLNHVVSTLNAKEVWDTLKTIHEANNEARVQLLLNEFIRFRIETTIDEGASRLNRIQQEISNLDAEVKPSDKIKTETLLCGLGPEYDSIQVALDSATRGTFEEVVAKLRRAESRLTNRNDMMNGQDTARIAENDRNGQQKKKKTRKGVCYGCGKPGHFKRECRAPQGDNPPGNSGQNAQLAQVDEGGENAFAWTVTTEAKQAQQDDSWCLDSGATAHMTYMREAFTEISPAKEETVAIANGKNIRVLGRGDVRLCVNGKGVQLINVLYVPELTTNLISVRQLAGRGTCVSFDDTGATLKNSQGTLMTVGVVGNSYVLKATPMGRGTQQAYRAVDGELRNVTALWHRRLGHAG